MKLSKQRKKVYDALYLSKYSDPQFIMDTTGKTWANISSVLTYLRRRGLVESQDRGGKRVWRRFPLDMPRIPPQPDFIERVNSKPVEKESRSVDIIMDEMINLMVELRDAVISECKVSAEDKQQLEQLRQMFGGK